MGPLHGPDTLLGAWQIASRAARCKWSVWLLAQVVGRGGQDMQRATSKAQQGEEANTKEQKMLSKGEQTRMFGCANCVQSQLPASQTQPQCKMSRSPEHSNREKAAPQGTTAKQTRKEGFGSPLNSLFSNAVARKVKFGSELRAAQRVSQSRGATPCPWLSPCPWPSPCPCPSPSSWPCPCPWSSPGGALVPTSVRSAGRMSGSSSSCCSPRSPPAHQERSSQHPAVRASALHAVLTPGLLSGCAHGRLGLAMQGSRCLGGEQAQGCLASAVHTTCKLPAPLPHPAALLRMYSNYKKSLL